MTVPSTSAGRHHLKVFAGALLTVLALTGALASSAWAHSAMERASAGPLGGNGPHTASIAGGQVWDSTRSGVSEDGSILYFLTAEQMTVEDTDNSTDVYKRDDGVTTIVSDDSSAAPDAEFNATFSGSSKDGSSAFFTGEVGGTLNQYVLDDTELRTVPFGTFGGFTADGEKLATSGGGVALVTLSTGSIDGVGPGNFSSMTDDGSRVFFTTNVQVLAEDTDASVDVYEWILSSSTTNRVSRGASAGSGNGAVDAFFEGASNDGTHVFFSTNESLAATDSDAVRDAYDRSGASTTIHVSQGAINGNGAFEAGFGRSSDDGNLVFFSTKENLTANDSDGFVDVYRRDLSTSTTFKISIGNGAFNARLAGDQPCGTFGFPPCSDGPGCDPFCNVPPPGSALKALQGDVSADGQHVFYNTAEPLSVPPPNIGASNNDVYERVGTTTNRLVSTVYDGNVRGQRRLLRVGRRRRLACLLRHRRQLDVGRRRWRPPGRLRARRRSHAPGDGRPIQRLCARPR